jgi:hypothetical protein
VTAIPRVQQLPVVDANGGLQQQPPPAITTTRDERPLVVDAQGDPLDGKDIGVSVATTVSSSAFVADGRPLLGAHIDAVPAASLRASGAPSWTWPREVHRDIEALDGTFSLVLDPGTYDITVRPTDGTRLPWVVLPSYVVGPVPTSLAPFIVPAPVDASMIIHDVSDNPVAKALVRIYAQPPASSVAIEIGRGITDAQGAVQLYLKSPSD